MTLTWHIPPVGWCAVCLIARHEQHPALVLWQGTSLCEEHLRDVQGKIPSNIDLG